MNILNALNTYINKMIASVISLCVVVIVGIVLFEIILRNLFGVSLGIVVDFTRLIFMWMVFLGVVYLFNNHGLIHFEFFESKAPEAFKNPLFFINRLVSLVLFIVMILSGKDLYEFVSIQSFSSFKLSLLWLYLPIPIAGVLMTLGCIEQIASKVIELTSTRNNTLNGGGLK